MTKSGIGDRKILVPVTIFFLILMFTYASEYYLFSISQLLGICFFLDQIDNKYYAINRFLKLLGAMLVLCICLEIFYIQLKVLPIYIQLNELLSFLFGFISTLVFSIFLCRSLFYFSVLIKRSSENQTEIKELDTALFSDSKSIKKNIIPNFGIKYPASKKLLKFAYMTIVVLVYFIGLSVISEKVSKPQVELIEMSIPVPQSIFYRMEERHRKPHIFRIDQIGKMYLDNELMINEIILQKKFAEITEKEIFPKIEIYPSDHTNFTDFLEAMKQIKKSKIVDFCLICEKSSLPEETPDETNRLDQLKLQQLPKITL